MALDKATRLLFNTELLFIPTDPLKPEAGMLALRLENVLVSEMYTTQVPGYRPGIVPIWGGKDPLTVFFPDPSKHSLPDCKLFVVDTRQGLIEDPEAFKAGFTRARQLRVEGTLLLKGCRSSIENYWIVNPTSMSIVD